jgi:hypothetical protein
MLGVKDKAWIPMTMLLEACTYRIHTEAKIMLQLQSELQRYTVDFVGLQWFQPESKARVYYLEVTAHIADLQLPCAQP